MKVVNMHKRVINQPKDKMVQLFTTLATKNDQMLATDLWPAMKLDKGLAPGSKGGHGPIRYQVTEYKPEGSISFQFQMKGWNGFHRFDITATESNKTELSHVIDMTTTGLATYHWALVVRWLHDAYIEDAFDKVENHFSQQKKRTEWNWWVKILRSILK